VRGDSLGSKSSSRGSLSRVFTMGPVPGRAQTYGLGPACSDSEGAGLHPGGEGVRVSAPCPHYHMPPNGHAVKRKKYNNNISNC